MTNDFEVSVIVETAKESEYLPLFSLMMMLAISMSRQFGIESSRLKIFLKDDHRHVFCASLNTSLTAPRYHFTINTHAMFAKIM